MSTLHPFENEFRSAWPPVNWQDVTVLLAISGGGDSVALLRAMRTLKQGAGGSGQLVVAHYNHGYRGGQADADEAFVVALCQQLDCPCHVGRVEAGLAPQAGLEEEARRRRYRFLDQVARRSGARYVVTAHTRDDQAETVLHRLLRGTGLAGLAGIRRVRQFHGAASLIRPLLAFRRSCLQQYLRDLGQPYQEDVSNWDTRWTRNRIRHELMPQLARDFNPQVVEALARLGKLAAEAQSVIDALVQQRLESNARFPTPDRFEIRCDQLADEHSYLVREMLIAAWKRQHWPQQAMHQDKWEQLAALVGPAPELPKNRVLTLPGKITATREKDVLRLQRETSP